VPDASERIFFSGRVGRSIGVFGSSPLGALPPTRQRAPHRFSGVVDRFQ
jgi:hypothetical protein